MKSTFKKPDIWLLISLSVCFVAFCYSIKELVITGTGWRGVITFLALTITTTIHLILDLKK